MSGVDLFKIQARNIQSLYPTLNYHEDSDVNPFIEGRLVLRDSANNYIDAYSIRITPSEFYPLRFPFVFELEGRLPFNIDWHVFEDGRCCIKSLPEEILICKTELNISQFIEEQVVPYFFNQKHRELFGYYLKERSHGSQGHIEFFEDVFKTNNLNRIAKALFHISRNYKPSRVDKCFCGSSLKYRKCCREPHQTISIFSKDEIEIFLRMVINSPRFSI
ncbi:YecA family protein [Daejeonella lutea]|uniref:SEC-C motif-containing protein n=1 Tax=Daejeonella lutea TaxID=572036 RepID=A0A1T5CXL8_9SPHI|nr:SEC-C motif-containing protein [Daejeonella lutea]